MEIPTKNRREFYDSTTSVAPSINSSGDRPARKTPNRLASEGFGGCFLPFVVLRHRRPLKTRRKTPLKLTASGLNPITSRLPRLSPAL